MHTLRRWGWCSFMCTCLFAFPCMWFNIMLAKSNQLDGKVRNFHWCLFALFVRSVIWSWSVQATCDCATQQTAEWSLLLFLISYSSNLPVGIWFPGDGGRRQGWRDSTPGRGPGGLVVNKFIRWFECLSPTDWHSMWVGCCQHSLKYLESQPLHQLTCAPCGGEVDAHLCAHGIAFLCMSSLDACKWLIDLLYDCCHWAYGCNIGVIALLSDDCTQHMDMWPPYASGSVFVWIPIDWVKWFTQHHSATIVLLEVFYNSRIAHILH